MPLSGIGSAAMDSGATIVIAELEAGTGIGSPFGGASPKGEPQDEKSLRGASSASLVGFAWVDPRGAFGSAPYLKLIAVDASARSSGIGAALLAEFEKRTAGQGRLWTLLVSDFNTRAQAFYASHGYREAGRLAGFAIEGVAEIIMVKAKT